MKGESIYIIANPSHSLGFLVMTDTEPIGFNNPLNALTTLAQLRKELGVHIKLYRVEPVTGPVVTGTAIEQFNSDQGITNCDYSLIGEYINEGE